MKPPTRKQRSRDQRSYRRTRTRRLLFEPLENRYLLAADFGAVQSPYLTTLADNEALHGVRGRN
jgi:hypothetical protein